MTPCIKLESCGAIFFWEFLDDFPECFLMYANGRGMFKILEKLENIGFGVVKILKKNRISGRKIPDSPLPQQGASDPISELTGLCSYLFYPNLFPSQINVISTNNKKNRMPSFTEC